MKNIAIISPTLDSGGAERIAGLLSKELSKYYNVYLFLLDIENIVYEYGGKLVDIGDCGPFFECSIKEKKKEYRIDVSISFMEVMNFANIRSRGRERVIISERCIQSLIEPPNAADKLQIKRYYDFADEIVACSWGVRYEQEKIYGVKTPVTPVYNFINKEKIRRQSEEGFERNVQDFLGDSEYYINVGRLHEQKNQKKLIRQFRFFHENIDVKKKLLIFGSGECREELERLISDYKLGNHVRIFSYDKNPFRYMRNAIALLVTSRYEGLPNVVLEAMTLRCPVIAGDCLSGPGELLDDNVRYDTKYKGIRICKRGIIVENCESEDTGETHNFAEAMNLVCDREIRNRIIPAGVSYMDQYENADILQRWIDVIEKEERKEETPVDLEMKRLNSADEIYIYGAGNVGKSFYEKLSGKYRIKGFVVSDKFQNSFHTHYGCSTAGRACGMHGYKSTDQYELYGIPVLELKELENKGAAIIIGVSYKYQNEVVGTLLQCGYNNILFPWINYGR